MTIILRPDHFTIVTDDLVKTEMFYTGIMGFRVGPRPDFSFSGLWLYIGDAAILHVKHVEHMPSPRTGVLDHMAFRGADINLLLRTLKSAALTYELKKTPSPWVQWQVFFEDPNGAVVEVDFDGEEILDLEFQT